MTQEMSVKKNKTESVFDDVGVRDAVLVVDTALIVGTWWWFTVADAKLEARIKKLEESDKANKKRIATLTAQVAPLKTVLSTVRDHAEQLEEKASKIHIKNMRKKVDHIETFLVELEVNILEAHGPPPKTGHLTKQQIDKRKKELQQKKPIVKKVYQESSSDETLQDISSEESSQETEDSNQSLDADSDENIDANIESDDDRDPFIIYDEKTKEINKPKSKDKNIKETKREKDVKDKKKNKKR